MVKLLTRKNFKVDDVVSTRHTDGQYKILINNCEGSKKYLCINDKEDIIWGADGELERKLELDISDINIDLINSMFKKGDILSITDFNTSDHYVVEFDKVFTEKIKSRWYRPGGMYDYEKLVISWERGFSYEDFLYTGSVKYPIANSTSISHAASDEIELLKNYNICI